MALTADQAKQAATEAALQQVSVQTAGLFGIAPEGIQDAREKFRWVLASIRRGEEAVHQVIDEEFAKVDPPAPAGNAEADLAYRTRLLRAVAQGTVHHAEITTAVGARLDELGGFYSIKRK